MERQQQRSNELHDDLAAELDKRDKALAEAIDVIISLEARVAELARERAMVRYVEADYPSLASPAYIDGAPTDEATTRPGTATEGAAQQGGVGHKGVTRMPSFMSDQDERTANLRDLVLANKDSYLHMRKISESSAEHGEGSRLTSSSVSILSESSFLSVYGKSRDTPQPDEPDRTEEPPKNKNPGPKPGLQGPPLTPTPRKVSTGSDSLMIETQQLQELVQMTSPLQRLERLRTDMFPEAEGEKPTARVPAPATRDGSRSRIQTKQERRERRETRETLRRVMTASPTEKDVTNSTVLPPTPDTVSSSTLQRRQSSDDTLSRRSRQTCQSSFVNDGRGPTPANTSRATSSSDFRRHLAMPNLGPDLAESLGALTQLGHAAGETISPSPSHSTSSSTSDPDSDSDSDGGVDAHSESGEMDYWLRESVKPNKRRAANRSPSPEPSLSVEGTGWESDALLGALGGDGFLGSPAAGLERDPADRVLCTPAGARPPIIRPATAVLDDHGRVVPPERRSSVQRRGGSRTDPPEGGRSRRSHNRSTSITRRLGRVRSNSMDTPAGVRGHGAGGEAEGEGSARRGQYPPIAGQAARSKRLSGLGGLFRRSIGGSGDLSGSAPASPQLADQSPRPPSQRQKQTLPPRSRQAAPSGRSSVPPPATAPWKPPTPTEDDCDCATPPPIMRSRAPSVSVSAAERSLDEPLTPREPPPRPEDPDPEPTPTPGSTGNTPQSGRRKWLGLGKMSGLRSRNG